jgi:hybrid polyketide synthase/nonribosomal peptide synthetase ACE1
MWDAEADGYARGEGSAAVVLKLLHQAIADGDDIECIIRETGVNQDGRTAGITVPSVCSQTELIRSTYRRCGLDCSKPEDRCQYFEAHGTGTLAGDPVEAEAVRNAFFDKLRNFEDTPVDSLPELLHVGSIKTVVGHLEGAAGLAGLLKASLAIQHGLIPGNMHFNQLNPAITPFYDHLRVPTKTTPWPELPQSVPRRASVNSFGFGGTNCHAILERWEPDGATLPTGAFPCGPFTISANSKPSLRSAIAALADKLKNTEESKINLADLAFTLQMRRSVLPFKASVSATTSPELIGKLASYLSASQDAESNSPWCTASARVTESLPPRILGVFTGQGAQWPRMGASLYEKSAGFRRSMQDLERSLASLPDPPEWSMVSELLAAAPTSRVHEAAISQPLCTALQISLVDLLASCGIAFHGVVGHSSGEIAAAYAAGYINAHDAIRIAYYRGVHADFSSHRDAPGRMMAVRMGFEEARNFCLRDQFVGRIVVAASNSRSSTTLSGDADAIDEAKSLLDSIEVFARILKVEKAYHSHHMDACSQPYLDSLRHCNIAVQSNSQDNCKWFSSVYGPDGRSIHNPTALKNEYWVENLSQPVLFSQALDRAVTESYCYDMVLEVGPHAALESPAKETLKTLTGVDIPYVGCLSRGKNDMTAFSDALGFLWRHFQSPTPVVDFQGFRRACIGQEAADKASVIKGLPTYVWDHDKVLWNESRVSRLYRERRSPPHELLGTATSDGNMKEVRWRNIFKLREMEWLRGHQFQGQVLFPAAGYVSMAIEAAIRLVDSEQHAFVQFVELKDLIIHDAITLEEDSRGTDVRFVIRVTERSSTWIAADYTCYSADVDGSSQGMDKVNFTGRAVVTLGVSPKPLALPAREAPRLPLANLELSRFYSSLEDIGLHYTGDFVMESACRMLNTATITARDLGSPLLVHPATLDATFQGVFAAYCFPGDGRLRSGYLPTSIECVRVDVSALDRSQSKWRFRADSHSRLLYQVHIW